MKVVLEMVPWKLFQKLRDREHLDFLPNVDGMYEV